MLIAPCCWDAQQSVMNSYWYGSQSYQVMGNTSYLRLLVVVVWSMQQDFGVCVPLLFHNWGWDCWFGQSSPLSIPRSTTEMLSIQFEFCHRDFYYGDRSSILIKETSHSNTIVRCSERWQNPRCFVKMRLSRKKICQPIFSMMRERKFLPPSIWICNIINRPRIPPQRILWTSRWCHGCVQLLAILINNRYWYDTDARMWFARVA